MNRVEDKRTYQRHRSRIIEQQIAMKSNYYQDGRMHSNTDVHTDQSKYRLKINELLKTFHRIL